MRRIDGRFSTVKLRNALAAGVRGTGPLAPFRHVQVIRAQQLPSGELRFLNTATGDQFEVLTNTVVLAAAPVRLLAEPGCDNVAQQCRALLSLLITCRDCDQSRRVYRIEIGGLSVAMVGQHLDGKQPATVEADLAIEPGPDLLSSMPFIIVARSPRTVLHTERHDLRLMYEAARVLRLPAMTTCQKQAN